MMIKESSDSIHLRVSLMSKVRGKQLIKYSPLFRLADCSNKANFNCFLSK